MNKKHPAEFKEQVNRRFIECVNLLKSRGFVPSDKDFGKSIDLSPANYSDIKANRRSVTTEILSNTYFKYGINPLYVINGVLPRFKDENNPENKFKQNIMYVPTEAAAGYFAGFSDDRPVTDFMKFSLPGFNGPEYFAFVAKGESMYSTLSSGDMVVTTKVEKPDYIRDNEMYVILTTEGLNVKRLTRAKQKGEFLFVSDNKFYKAYSVPGKNIRKVFLVEGVISQNTFPRNYFEERILNVQTQINELKD
jgi:hypothetical protein